MTNLSPEDSLWVEILRRDERLKSIPRDQRQAFLSERGFPSTVINAYLQEM